MLNIRSQGKDPFVPPITVSALFDLSCVGHKNDIAINQNEQNFTRRQLQHDRNTLAKAFMQLGVKTGDIVTVAFDRPLYENILIFLAANRVGAAVCFLDERVPRSTLVNYVEEFRSPILVTYKETAESVQALQNDAKGVRHIINLSGDFSLECLSIGDTPVSELAARCKTALPKNAFAAENPALVTFTSGSSSGPKPMVFTNKSLVAGAIFNKTASGVKMWDKRFHTWMQLVRFCYPYGFWVSTMSPILGGGTVILTPDLGKDTFAYYFSKNPDTVFGAPALIELLVKYLPADVCLDNLKMFASGGERLETATAEKALAFFEHHGAVQAVLCNGYGLGEVLGLVSTSVGQAYHPGTVGKIPAGVHVVIRHHETGEELGFNEPGIVCVSGQHMLSEYFNRPDSNAQRFEQIDGRRFLITGDTASVDEDGFVTLLGRSIFFLNNIPSKVYYEYVNSAVARSPLVSSSWVVRIPDDEYEYAACAFVVPRDGVPENDATRQAILETAAEPFWVGKSYVLLRSYEIPRRIVFLDAMPLTAADKVDYLKLEQMAAALP